MVLSGVGATLKQERQRRQFSLEYVANETRIASRYLDAIEGGRMADLPGIVFTRGWVRQYATFLELPVEELLARLPKVDVDNAALPVAPPKPSKPLFTAGLRKKLLGFGSLAVTASACAAGWIYFDLTPVLSAAAHGAISAASATLAARSTTNRPASDQTAKPVPVPVIQTVAAAPQPATEAPATPEPAVEAPPAATEVVRNVQVRLRAKADAWVSVMADGKPAFSGLLRPNDSREVSGNQLVRVMTGNAGGLEISLNGKPLDPIGPSGQVRTVRLTAEGLLPDEKAQQQPEPDPLP